ncbi:unknown [Eubacterium sp. CAG:786]|nr:unknown [Eubacterium sp. CAG:786]
MGYQSGMRKEVFNNIVMNRAAKMKKLADSGDKEAISLMKDIGLSKKENEDGKGETFSLQGIAEKLGMENNDTWENQLEQSKKYRIYDRSNPFLPKTTGGA